MKKYLLFLIVLVLAFTGCKPKNAVGPNGVTYKTALDYSNYVVDRQNDIMKDIMDYGKAAGVSIDAADVKLDQIVSDLTVRLKDIEGMPSYHGDSAFRDAAINLFRFYKSSFSTDFKEMHTIKRRVESGNASEEDQKRLSGFSEYLAEKERPYDEKLKETQTKFAKDNDFKLVNNTMQEKMDKMK